MKKSFFEQYNNNNERETIILGNRSFASAVISFLEQLVHLVLYVLTMGLASVGLTTLANKPLRDLFIEMVKKLF